jgi:hypothetical protein
MSSPTVVLLFSLPKAQRSGKSAKRGEPHIYLLCVTLWASAGGVVNRRAFVVPVPRGKKIKARHLGLDTLEGVLGPSFFHSESAIRGTRPQKSRYTSITLACRIDRPPKEDRGRSEDLSPSPSVRQPNDCCPRKRHVWGTRQSRWFRGPAALLYELSLFVLTVTSRNIDPSSDRSASDIARPVIVPHAAKRAQTLASTCKGVGAFFLGLRDNRPDRFRRSREGRREGATIPLLRVGYCQLFHCDRES